MQFKAVSSVLLIGFVLLFGAQNLALVDPKVGIWTDTVPRSLVLFSALGGVFVVQS